MPRPPATAAPVAGARGADAGGEAQPLRLKTQAGQDESIQSRIRFKTIAKHNMADNNIFIIIIIITIIIIIITSCWVSNDRPYCG